MRGREKIFIVLIISSRLLTKWIPAWLSKASAMIVSPARDEV
jgi:hypothetical protein